MPTDWESRYQTGDMPWEKGAPSPGLVEYLGNNPPMEGKILVPGCGWGHDVRALSHRGNAVVGLDIAPSGIEGARKFPRTGNESYRLGDLFEMPDDFCGAFDWVWEHTCFCAIDPAMRPRYAQSVAAALKPGGRFLAIFYLNPDHEDPGAPPFGVTPEELDALFNGVFELEREWTPGSFYAGREGRERMRLMRKRS
jgi:SAM-dependent methyltransferase